MDCTVAVIILEDVVGTICWSLKNQKFCMHRRLVFRWLPVTDRYLHERIEKKNAPVHKSAIAWARLVVLFLYSRMRTDPGRAFCCFGGGSLFLQLLY